eukprot:4368954-Amphidinium_carterae.1
MGLAVTAATLTQEIWGWVRDRHWRTIALAVVRALLKLEECSPRRVVIDCKGVVKVLHALQKGQGHPNYGTA